MKKIFVLILVLVLYLNRSYAYFYDFLAQKHLIPPANNIKTTLGASHQQFIRYVALGDSLTQGVGANNYQNTYPYQIAQKLASQRQVELVNLARPGDTSNELLNNQLPQVQALQPNIVTILIGINDLHNLQTTAAFENNLSKIITNLKTTGARIYLLSLPYLGSGKIVYFPYNLILDWRTKQFNQIISKIANDNNVSYIDLYKLPKSAQFYSADEFHPADWGYLEWSKAINVN